MNFFIKLGICIAAAEISYLITTLILGLTVNVPFMIIAGFVGVMAIVVGMAD